jgi:hypothetical protein
VKFSPAALPSGVDATRVEEPRPIGAPIARGRAVAPLLEFSRVLIHRTVASSVHARPDSKIGFRTLASAAAVVLLTGGSRPVALVLWQYRPMRGFRLLRAARG